MKRDEYQLLFIQVYKAFAQVHTHQLLQVEVTTLSTCKMLNFVVLSCLMAAASAALIAPIAPIVPFSPLTYGAPVFWNNNYRGPLSLAPGQPANILGADGRPLDTLEVNQDRAANIAKSLGFHVLKKRSAQLIATLSIPYAVAHSSFISPGTRLAYTAPHFGPITYTAPVLNYLVNY